MNWMGENVPFSFHVSFGPVHAMRQMCCSQTKSQVAFYKIAKVQKITRQDKLYVEEWKITCSFFMILQLFHRLLSMLQGKSEMV